MKKPVVNILIVNLLILVVYFPCGLFQFILDSSINGLYISNFIFIILAVILLVHDINHIAYTKQRIQLIIITGLILLLVLLRAFKYIAFANIEIMARHIWYLYYLPIIFMPYFLFVAALTNYYDNHKKIILPIYIITGLISLILFALIITNDSHQLAFQFNDNFANWDNDYKYGFLYYLTSGYVILLFIASFIVFYHQCRVTNKRRYGFLSLLPLLFGLIWIVLDFFSLLPRYKGVSVLCLFPETFCFTVAGYLINLVSLNLITSNKNYDGIFKAMSLPAVIRDSSDAIIYQNSDVPPVNIKDEQVIIDNNLYKNVNISGGRITWISDISELLKINNELSEINERLKEEEQLHKLENTLKEEQLIISEKNKLYDEIAREVSSESNRIISLAKEIKKDESLYNKRMPEILFLSIYIKRFANLKLLAKEKETIDINELYLSIKETFRYLDKTGVKGAIVGQASGTYDSLAILKIYCFVVRTLIGNLNHIKGVTAFFSDSNLLKIIIEIDKLILDESTLNGVYYSLNKEDDVYYIVFKGGNRDASI